MIDLILLEEAGNLKLLALDNYALDGGEMFECTDTQGYIDLIKKHVTAEAAWEHELMGAKIRAEYAAECRAAYDDCDDTEAENEYLGSLDYEARFY